MPLSPFLTLLGVLTLVLGPEAASRGAGTGAASRRAPSQAPIEVMEFTLEEVSAELGRAGSEPHPTRWMSKLRRCSRRGALHFCDGPRMVPVPTPEAAARAERLGLGLRSTANRLLVGAPEPAWIEAAGGAREGLSWPVDDGHVSRGYGFVRRAELRHRKHDGVDFVAATGTRVRAANTGLVVYADNGVSGFGNLVMIVHGDGSTTLYAHLSEAHVAAGQRVERGQTIGAVGTTGLSRGPHLHFEWRRRGRPLDPRHAFVRPRLPSIGDATGKG
jgi:hypothetical protein